MKWQALPGPASFIEGVIRQLRDGISVVVATPMSVRPDLEDIFVKQLVHDGWYLQRESVDSSEDPLKWLTERLCLEPEQWLGWSVEKFFGKLSSRRLIAIDGVTGSNWDAWRTFLRDFEAVSRRQASDERSILLLFVRGVSQKHLQAKGAALAINVWSGVFGELDMLIYVDQRLRSNRGSDRHHKLIVRQIAALALWDIDLADYLVERPERDLFDTQIILKAAQNTLHRNDRPMSRCWECDGLEQFDGIEMLHPFVLVDDPDVNSELLRRVWAAQAAVLLPLIELRRKELILSLEKSVPCPFSINGKDQINSLHELEIGSLVHVARIRGIRGTPREKAELLARCRNTLAHLGLLGAGDAMDSRLYC